MTTDKTKPPFDDKPWFADRQEELLRADQRAGAHLVFRREDGEWVREAPDGTQTLLGYRDEDDIKRKLRTK